MTFVFDNSDRTTVTVCGECGWRMITSNKNQANHAARAHRAHAHPADQKAAAQLEQRIRRAGQQT